MNFDFDLFVIGGGSGGVRAARMAAQTGAKVALCEEFRMGGTCVIRGCVPKKLLVYAAGFAESFEDARGFGWSVGKTTFDWSKLIGAKDREIDRLEGIYRTNLDKVGVTVFNAHGTVSGAQSVTLSSGEAFTAKTILIATGGHPFVPEFPGSELAITSNDVFDLKTLPDRILVVGGGYIACEFAGIFNGMGANVSQFYRGAQVLRGFDDEVRGHVAEEMIAKGINLHLGMNVQSIEKSEGGLKVVCENGTITEVDLVVYATGRNPVTANLGLSDVGVETGRRGEIVVDDFSQSSVASIYAVGDVTNRVNLTPVAIREGAAFVKTVFEGIPTKPDHTLIPTAVFTQPEIGTVGLSEEQARDEEPIEVYATSFRPMMHILAERTEKMLMKLVVSVATRKVLGVHIVGHGAGEMIQLAGIAVKMGATKEDFDQTVAVHPTAAEELVTMSTVTRTA
jgi:glutathione reductase (NADPH)